MLSLPCMAEETISFDINGLKEEMLKNANTRLGILLENIGTPLTVNGTIEFYQKAPENIREAIQPFGYFHAKISQHIIKHNSHTYFHFNVVLGIPIRISKITLLLIGAGKNNTLLNKALLDFPLKKDQILQTADYEKFKRQWFNLALEEGYLNAFFAAREIRINTKKNTAVIILSLDTGQRYYFGSVTFKPIFLSESLLRRYIPFQEGQPFSSQKLANFQQILSSTPYFQQVSIENSTPQKQTHIVPISVNLTLKKAKEYLAGIGYGTDTGPRLTAGVNVRYLNPEGHYLKTLLIASSIQNSLQAAYFIPGKNPATDKYSLNTSLTQNNLEQGTSRTAQLGANYIHIQKNNWERTLSLNYTVEQFKFNNAPFQISHLLVPGIRYQYLSSNDPVFPTQGQRFSVELKGAPQINFASISDTSFLQSLVQEKYITHFTDNNRLILQVNAGYTVVHDLNVFPLSLQFYSGGAQSVRGYSYQSLGPGRYLLTTSAEFQQRIKDQWYGAIFYDAGNAANTLDLELKRGAGIGIVWVSPIGKIELTLAKALSVPGQPNRIQFTMGADL